jgi:hypothetical protein
MQITARAHLPLDDAGHPADGLPLSGISWHCDIECGAPSETIQSINRLVCAFSPNHRVFLDASPIEMVASVRRDADETETIPVSWAPASPPPSPVGTCPVEAQVTWEYGSEATYRTAVGEQRWTGPFTVDQAKQMLGIDKGPNSQEILLSALCGELTHLIRAESAARGIELDDVQLRLSGRLDERGMLNVLREISSSFHNLLIEVTLRSDAATADLHDLLSAAMARAILPATLAHSTVIGVELTRGGTRELAHDSTTSEVEAIRDDVIRRQQEAAAT